MKHIKIAAGLAHINYGKLTQLVKEAEEAGVDYIHSDAADMHDLQNMKLMGGWQIIQAIRPEVKIPVECHIYTISMDKMFIEQIHSAGANMLIIPAEHFIGAQLTYIINWCRERKIKVGLTIGCYTPLCFVEESIYDIDRLQIVRHGVDETDGADNRGWRRSVTDLVKRARKLIDEKNPKCELALDGGLRVDNMEPLIECNPDVIVMSSALFKDPDGITAAVKKCRKVIDDAAKKYNLE